MTCRGIVRGKFIELEAELPSLEGQPVDISVQALQRDDMPGSPAFARRLMHESPHLEPGDIEEFELTLCNNELPVEANGVFDEDREA